MAVQKVKSANPYKNNGGTVANGGAVSATGPLGAITVRSLSDSNNGYGSKLIEQVGSSGITQDPTGVKKARPSGTFSYNPSAVGERGFIIRAAGTASAGKINGTASNLLNMTGAEFAGVSRGKTNSKISETRLGVDQYSFPAVSIPNGTKYPGITRDPNRGTVYNFKSTTDNSQNAADKVLTANRSIPGELTYRTGAVLPKTTNIPPRDNTSNS